MTRRQLWAVGFTATLCSIPLAFVAHPRVAQDWHSPVYALAIGLMVTGVHLMGRWR